MTGLLVVMSVLAATTAFGMYRQRVAGRLTRQRTTRRGSRVDSVQLTAAELGAAELGVRATVVQFSSAFCAPCRATRTILTDVSAVVPGVAFVEVDAEARLDLVRRLQVARTPTILILDRDGQVVNRAVGQPRKADVLAALVPAIG